MNYAILHRAEGRIEGPISRERAQEAIAEGLEVFELVQVEEGQIECEIELEQQI